MNLIVDENISFAEEAFSKFGNVKLLHGRKIDRNSLSAADALVVRSITNVNRDLLEGTPVKFVGTATIGTDHIDMDYLHEKGITFTDAKGCNANAVAEYVFTALTNISGKNNTDLVGKTIGVVGIGNIGSRIVRLAESIGMKVLKNDPPVQRKTGITDFVSFDEILTADFITFHVPLNADGIDKTVHLLNDKNLSRLKDGTILINASRGQVIDNIALLEFIKNKKINVVLDVWENEPAINTDLLELVDLGSPHIAGYSLEGKVNGTKMMYDALCEFSGIEKTWQPLMPPIDNSEIEFESSGNLTEDLKKIFNGIYKIETDDIELKKMFLKQGGERAPYFDLLRKNYPLRREFLNYIIKLKNKDEKLRSVLNSFRFKIK